jgi:hypothetical protein
MENNSTEGYNRIVIKFNLQLRFAYQTSTTKPNLRFKDDFVFALGCLTVCVTRAGAGGGTPSDWKNAEA